MNRKVKFSILAIVILIIISVYFISQKEIEPPPAILKIDGKEQISGIGSYCWKGTWKALCVDYAGIPTVQEPLLASSPFTAHLHLPLQNPPSELQLDIIEVTERDELNLSARDWRWWSTWKSQGKRLTRPLERESDIELSLEPGLYVLHVEAWSEEGSVSYGFLVKVQANGRSAVPAEEEIVKVLKINPVIDSPLGGYTSKSGGMFMVLKGSIPEVKEGLYDIVVKKADKPSSFSVDDELNFVIFRGVFNSGGYVIEINRVERQGNAFTVYATYTDPGEGIFVTGAFTQPTAIIPIRKLAAGDYEARLKVTMLKADANGTKIITKVVETEKELDVFNFTVKSVTAGNPQESVPSESLKGQIFDEASGILTKNWDAGNFAGFWRDLETNVSTETMVIDQSVLNNNHRVIEKHNLIYITKSIPLKYQVYAGANETPPGTDGFYSAIGWQGEKYVFLPGNRIARIILEQNASEEKFMRPHETWNLGEGYSIFVNSVEVKAGTPQTWFTLIRGGEKINDVILGPYIERLYVYQTEQDAAPIIIIYFSGFKLDGEAFKYGWLRSQNLTDIKEGEIFGVMEVTFIKNDTIELRNKEPIDLVSGTTIRLMGDIGIQVNNSKTGLLFYPVKGRNEK